MGDFLNFKLLQSSNFVLTVYDLLIALVIMAITMIILRIVKRVVQRLKKQDSANGMYWSIYLIVRYIIWTIVAILLLDTVGVKISVLLASITALLVGLGLGIQQLFNDVASGIVMIVERNVQIDDVIELEDGTVGRVLDIGLRTSKLKTRDDIIWIVPNSKFVNEKVINWSHISERNRFHVSVGVAYGSDVELVREVLLSCVSLHEEIEQSPAPFVRFKEFGNSSLDFQLFFWVRDSFRVENTKSDLRFLIDRAFRRAGVQIPFSQQDIHFKNPIRVQMEQTDEP